MSKWQTLSSAHESELMSFISKLLLNTDLEESDWIEIEEDFEYRLKNSEQSRWMLDVDYCKDDYAFRLKLEFDPIMRDNELTLVVRNTRFRGDIADLTAVNTIWTLSR